MDRRVRYEVLQSEDDTEIDEPAEYVAVTMVIPPDTEDPQTQTEAGATGGQESEPSQPQGQGQAETGATPGSEQAKFFEPPPYSVATTLPSYEEAERTKAEEAEQSASRELELEQEGYGLFAWNNSQSLELGTDCMFLCTFALAVVFSWIGLLAAICLSRTIAGRLGAVAGFGLSLVKWVALIKHTNLGNGVAGDSWLWWLLILLGFLIFFRGCTQYIRIKYQYQHFARFLQQPHPQNIDVVASS